ncbi:nuclear transport factor 2 family protein [Clostridium sp.]|jgi:hypothetical protein|uniref:nuclear transport factor 2 family protein n=1 Tax=Clostridium sp. TaxID=1506 RepID=UPI002589FDE4|nr:nuclear transport factor 2 family protein [Clostridium sp.]MDF2503978.1 hypothetical protein [Clostridium sp.]
MHIKLPKTIDTFIKSKNEHDSHTFISCFTDNAVVQDEGQNICGTKAIKEWNEKTTAQFNDTLEAVKLVERDENIILTATVSGNFDGSPVDLDFYFNLSNGKISSLKILVTEE